MYYVAVFMYPYSLDCSAVSVANQIYYLLESTILTIPACIVSTSTTQLTLTSTPISAFATATKNADNSFKIALASSDLSLVGTTFAFSLEFSDIFAEVVT